jgi:2-polyprenyl-3-methyl-5-hydroxy-6-metoxy-1,4-benzoquinol methylase
MEDITQINKKHYNNTYRKRFFLVELIYPFISFDQQSKSKRNYRLIKDRLERNCRTGGKILDYGFGHGSLLLKFSPKHQLFGCDISEVAVAKFPDIAKFYNLSVFTFLPKEMEKVIGKGKFDLIVCSHVLEHLENDLELLMTFKNLLKPNGKLLINLPINEVWVDPNHKRKYTKERVVSILNSLNLTQELIIECDRLSSFLIYHEHVSTNRAKKLIFRFSRICLAIAPVSLWNFIDRLLINHYEPQQLQVIAQIEKSQVKN